MKAYFFIDPYTHMPWLFELSGVDTVIVWEVNDDLTPWLAQAEGALLAVNEWDYEGKPSVTDIVNIDWHLSVLVTYKHYFPKFNTSRDDFSYQLYDIEEIDTLAWLLKKCIELAESKLGIALNPKHPTATPVPPAAGASAEAGV